MKLGFHLRASLGLIGGGGIVFYFILDTDFNSTASKTVDTPIGVFGVEVCEISKEFMCNDVGHNGV